MTSRPLVLAMVPATSASSTIDRLVSVFGFVSSRSCRQCRLFGAAAQPPKAADRAQAWPFRRTAACWPRSTTAGRSGEPSASPSSRGRSSAAVAPLKAMAAASDGVDKVGQLDWAWRRGWRLSRLPGAAPRRPRPTRRCARRQPLQPCVIGQAARSSPIAGRASARTGWSDAHNNAARRATRRRAGCRG